MADMIKFYKGLEASLPASGVNGALYITTDEGAIYLGTGTGMKRLGDFVQVDNVASLPEKAHESCLYYCVAENILAKWNGTEWKQINKQPTAEEMKTLLGLGSLAYLSEVAEGNLNADLAAKINAASGAQHTHANKDLLDTYTQTETDLADAVAKKHAHANADELAKIVDGDKAKWDAVAADHLTSADKTALENSIKEAKKAGTDANTALETYKVSNDARVLAVEEDIAEITNADNGILAQAKAYADGKDADIAAAKKAGDDAQADIDAYIESNDAALAGVKATADAAATKAYTDEELAKKVDKVEGKSLVDNAEITKLAGVSAGANKVEKSDVNGNIKVDGAEVTVYTHPATHTVSEISDFDEKVKAYDYATKAEAQGYVDTYKEANDKALADEVKAREDADAAINDKIGEVAEGKTIVEMIEDAQTAATYDDEEVRGLISDNADAIAAEKTRAEGIEAGLRTDVDAIKGDYLKSDDKTELADAIAAEKSRAEGVEADLQTQINTIMNNPDTEGVINSINEFTQYIADHGEIAEGFRTDIDANAKAIEEHEELAAETYETKIDAENKLKEAKEYADGINTAIDERLDVLEAINHDAYTAADAALKAELQAEIDADVKVVNDALEGYKTSNDAEVAKKANAVDVYAKTETFTKDEVNAAIEAAITEAHTWGSF